MRQTGVSITALASLPIFHGITADRLEAIGRAASIRRVTRGTSVILEGEVADNVYFVLNGNLKVVVTDEEGREVILTVLGPGDICGEMAAMDESPRSATVSTLNASDLIVFSRSDFKRVMQENFDVCMRLMSNLAQRLREADRKIESLALMDVYGRVSRLLLDMAETTDGTTIVRKKISKQDIAKMIGASREMVSRVMKDLQNRGLIEETAQGVVLHEQIYTVQA